jgi:hypothetical protein
MTLFKDSPLPAAAAEFEPVGTTAGAGASELGGAASRTITGPLRKGFISYR